MTPRRTGLTDDELTALTGGRRRTVYLVDAVPSLGLPAGTSARVVAVAGRTVTVRPKGVADDLAYDADELRTAREAPAPPPRAPRKRTPRPTVAAPTVPAPAEDPAPPVATPADEPAPDTDPAPLANPAPPGRRRAAPRVPAPVTITVHGSVDAGWTVTSARGVAATGPSRALAVPAVQALAAAVADPALEQAVAQLVTHVATRQVTELRARLAEAEAALAALAGPDAR